MIQKGSQLTPSPEKVLFPGGDNQNVLFLALLHQCPDADTRSLL